MYMYIYIEGERERERLRALFLPIRCFHRLFPHFPKLFFMAQFSWLLNLGIFARGFML